MKTLVFVLALVASVCFFAPVADACPVAVAGVTTFAQPVVVQNHCAVQAFAVPSVAVLATPVVVQQHGVVVQQVVKQRNVRVRSRTVTRVR